jgi:pyrroloquinoline quinone biosynthesis protein E
MMQGPLALIAEVTHRCPLHCVYCSNPLELSRQQEELKTGAWAGVFEQAAAMGTLQLHLTGGEPLARKDIARLAAAGRAAGLYVNLITSGVGMTEQRLDELARAGVEHIQISLQDSRAEEADWIAGTQAHAAKLALAALVRMRKLALTLNIVVHRANLDRIEEMIALAEATGADRLEIAHVQYYGWALANREQLLPTRWQVEQSLTAVEAARERLKGRMQIDCVTPDYYARFPKACMGGWGRKIILIDPAGRALPCHAAGVIPGLSFDNVTAHRLRWIWEESEAFQMFRGEGWMPEPCRSCDRRALDFGGCRCQALLLAGDAAKTDPVCELSPDHAAVQAAIERAQEAIQNSSVGAGQVPDTRSNALELIHLASIQTEWRYRTNPSRN